MRSPKEMQSEIVREMTKAEQDDQSIRQRDEQIKRLRAELDEFIKAEQVMVGSHD